MSNSNYNILVLCGLLLSVGAVGYAWGVSLATYRKALTSAFS